MTFSLFKNYTKVLTYFPMKMTILIMTLLIMTLLITTLL
jgi:hypothetical protein